jgi:DNA primase
MALPSEEIKEKLNLVDFLRGYLDLRPAGKNFKANCPFHSDKSPSFIVSPERQIWHCFGCGEGGDIFKFLMKFENLEFYEALKILAEKAGIELSRLSPTDQKQFGILYDITRIAAEFYKSKLAESERGRSYLAERKLNEDTIREFEIGFAPQGFDALHLHLIKSGFSVDDTVRAGLIFKTERGQYMDRFRGRVMFPIHNHFGKIVGFSGRILPELDNGEMGKYVNSPETPIFKKSRLLYGFWKSKNFIRESKTVLLVEGQMDFLMLWQDGIKNATASSGTALTLEHLKNLRRIADRIILGFDSDEAGLLAAERAIDLAGGEDFSVSVLSLKGSAIESGGSTDYKDPAEVVQNKPGLIIKYIEKSRPAMEHYFSRYIRTGGSENTKQDIRIILSKIKNLWSKIDQARWFRELSYRTGISERELSEELERIEESRPDKDFNNETMAPRFEEKKVLKRSELITERLLSLISVKDDFKNMIQTHVEFMPSNYRVVYDAMSGNAVQTRAMEEMLNLINLRSSFELASLAKEEKVLEEFKNLLRELEVEYFKEQIDEVKRQIAVAESDGNDDELLIKLKEFDNITKRIQKLKNGKES